MYTYKWYLDFIHHHAHKLNRLCSALDHYHLSTMDALRHSKPEWQSYDEMIMESPFTFNGGHFHQHDCSTYQKSLFTKAGLSSIYPFDLTIDPEDDDPEVQTWPMYLGDTSQLPLETDLISDELAIASELLRQAWIDQWSLAVPLPDPDDYKEALASKNPLIRKEALRTLERRTNPATTEHRQIFNKTLDDLLGMFRLDMNRDKLVFSKRTIHTPEGWIQLDISIHSSAKGTWLISYPSNESDRIIPSMKLLF